MTHFVTLPNPEDIGNQTTETIDNGGIMFPDPVRFQMPSPTHNFTLNAGEPWSCANQPALTEQGIKGLSMEQLNLDVVRRDSLARLRALMQKNFKFWDDLRNRPDIDSWGELASSFDDHHQQLFPTSGNEGQHVGGQA
ncbi:hypothetical protein HIM_12574 [Hirsutella minnesotensis 3608]|nr:hypothetical protein HIM_12574 [Hirsutella minnesotensis 3608]